MRVYLAIALLVSVANGGFSGPPADDQPLAWHEPFEPISASKAADTLVLVLITNEDPFQAAELMRQAKKRNPADAARLNRPVWCAEVLGRAYREVMDRRADLEDRIRVQSIVAGLPKELTGGESRNAPSRAVLAFCDGNYRLLSFMVGLPDVDELLTLIEDAEGVATMLQLNSKTPEKTVHAIARRSSERLDRRWQRVLEESIIAMQGDAGGDAAERERWSAGRMRFLSETYEPTYVADVRLRFGLTDLTDRTRLVFLEQHGETRRPWCQAMIPLLAGTDFMKTWRGLVESIWGHQPITAEAEATELLDWFDLQTKTDAVVLSLQPPLRLQYVPWPPIADKRAKRGIGWQEVHARAMEHPYRSVDAQQLAILIRSRGLKAIDIQRPTMVRYVLIERKKKSAYTARQGDPPGRFAGLLKRSQSNLVKP